MKKLLSVCLTVIMVLLTLCSCGGKDGSVNLVSGEIVETKDGYTVSFVFENGTDDAIDGLTVKIQTFTENGKIADEGEAVYPLKVESGANATLSFKAEKNCSYAKAVSFSYKDVKGKIIEIKPEKNNIAEIKTDSETETLTRESLAKQIISEVNNQFISQKTLSTGKYDAENKQLIIVSKYPENYDACYASYFEDPESWKSLEDGVVSMSLYCLEEFKNNNFKDVKVSVGVVSEDEEILFSALDGELTNHLEQQ